MFTIPQNQPVNLFPKGQALKTCPLHIFLHFTQNALTKITLEEGEDFALWMPPDFPQADEVVAWFSHYLRGNIGPFPLPLKTLGGFTKRVLDYLLTIPFGQTASYKEVAVGIGCPVGARAVGNACHNNPFPLVIPCHRVVKSDRSLGGFAYGLTIKKELLEFECTIHKQLQKSGI